MGSPMPGTSRGPASVLKELFEELADENGRITSAKLRSHVVSLGLEFTDEEIREMLEIADTSGKGAIDYKGFVELVRENADHLTALESSGIDLKREITMLLKELTVVKKQTEINNQNDTMVSAQKKNDDRLRTQPNYTSNGEKDADVVTGSAVKEQCIVEPSEPGENKNKETTDNYSGNEDQTLRKKQILQKTNIKHLVNNENSTEISQASAIEDTFAVATISDSTVDAEKNDNKNGENDTRQASPTDDKTDYIPDSSENKMEDREHRGNQINAHTNIDNENIKEESSIPNEDYTSSTTDVNEDQTESVPETIKSTVVKHDKKQGKSLVVPKITSVSKTNTKNIPLRTKKPIEQKSRVSGIVYTQAQKPKAVAAKPVVRKPRRKSEHWQLSEVGPEMQSSIGCEYKLSQIRLRQRIVYLMWRAVFDEAKRNTKRKVKL